MGGYSQRLFLAAGILMFVLAASTWGKVLRRMWLLQEIRQRVAALKEALACLGRKD